ncbi:hypothetical protein ACTOSX_13975, partial [Bacillus subtilis]
IAIVKAYIINVFPPEKFPLFINISLKQPLFPTPTYVLSFTPYSLIKVSKILMFTVFFNSL